MKFSLITPSHNLKYIMPLYNSIKEQTYTDWEWILYINKESEVVPDSIKCDERCKIYYDYSGNTNVGYLKNKAFNLGTGDILVEVDHDDLLMPTCLEELNSAFANPEYGFVYSDDAKLIENGKPFVPYSKQFGWLNPYYISYGGATMPVMRSFAPDSGSMAFIWYMPDHVRAWRKDVYKAIGGHNESLSILDDQDLIVRTYLVTKFHHIQKALYIYRITGDNTWIERNQAIQTGTVEMFHKYAYQLAERDAELRGLSKVDIGGGLNPKTGYTTIDLEDADIICDLNNGIPLPDNSVGVLNASHIIEHLKDPALTMKEIYRVLADGGWAFIDVPSTDGRGAWQDPTHCSFWNINSFWYWTRKDQAQYIRNNTYKFQEFRLENVFYNEWWKQNNIPCVKAWLRAVKSDERRAHTIMI